MRSGTLEWVYRVDARYEEVNGFMEPDYDDPVFLEKVENFVRAMAERYDGDSGTAFVDVGHFGMWGGTYGIHDPRTRKVVGTGGHEKAYRPLLPSFQKDVALHFG
jgi:hypothetical protein